MAEVLAKAPLYSHNERILLAPIIQNGKLNLDVRLETHSALVTKEPLADSISWNASPFPDVPQALLRRYGALRVQIQVAHLPQQSYPSSPLDSIPFLGGTRHQNLGPSGVSVTTTLVDYNTDQGALERFHALLRDLVSNRIILAPLASIDSQRLHRFQRTEPSTDDGIPVFKATTILPMEGSPVALEGMVAFQNILPPCGSQGGIFIGADASAWSNLLLGGGNSVPRRPRGFWIDLQSSLRCHATDMPGDCNYTISHGLYYTINTAGLPLQGSGSTTLSLSDIYPNDDIDTMPTCTFADSTSIDVVHFDGSDTETSFESACKTQDKDSLEEKDSLVSSSLTRDPIDLQRPCLSIPYNMSQDTTTDPIWHVDFNVLRPAGVANRGTFVSTLKNDDPRCGAEVSYSQTIPPIVNPIWQSFVITSSADRSQSWTSLADHDISFQQDGSVIISFRHRIPPVSSLTLSLDYDPAFLSFETFPGDANRGFEVPPVQAHFTSECMPHQNAQLYSQAHLVLAPLPDMSMPFNVLSLTCTLYAFIVGSLVNLLVRKASERVKYTLDPDSKPKSKLQKIKDRVKGNLRKVRAKLLGSKVGGDDGEEKGPEPK